MWTAVSAPAVIRVEGSGAHVWPRGRDVGGACVCVSCVRQGIPGIGDD